MMRVCVLGAGVIGVTTAYFLSKDGHEVTVIDRASSAGLETSFANGGQISVSHSDPWASPENLRKVLRWLGDPDAPLAFKFSTDSALWRWLGLYLRNCTSKRAVINDERMLRVAKYSQSVRNDLLSNIELDHDQQSTGILHIYRNAKNYDDAIVRAERTTELGCPRVPISIEKALQIEPALAHVAPDLSGVIYAPDDQSGDAHAFTDQLAALCRQAGVSFQFSTTVDRIELAGGKVSGVKTDQGLIDADAIVVALGSYSPMVLKRFGINLPIYPAKGYSVTLPVGDEHVAPSTALIDDEHKIVYSRLGDRLRAAGLAETVGYDTAIHPARAQLVLDHVMALFPNAGNAAEVEYWAGLRPQSPDSVPILGKTPINGLYLNTGHGTLGWTMSVGSGRIVADVIAGRAPDIDIADLGLGRFY
jgi:D-amino-acid dehydrogenase